jgi:CHAT domain-containing protein
VHGFELSGIARSAAEAGAATVVACLWPVEDAVAEQFMVTFYDSVTVQMRRGAIDFVAAFDEARAKLRTWLGSTTIPRESQRRDGRDIALSEDELDESVELTSDAILDAMMWAPFVLIGRPVLRAMQS